MYDVLLCNNAEHVNLYIDFSINWLVINVGWSDEERIWQVTTTLFKTQPW